MQRHRRRQFSAKSSPATRPTPIPFISAGTGATNLLKSFYGLGGDQALGAGALERFYQSPDYQFALKGGSDALNNSLAARAAP
jgi:hypothetical protein